LSLPPMFWITDMHHHTKIAMCILTSPPGAPAAQRTTGVVQDLGCEQDVGPQLPPWQSAWPLLRDRRESS
jgi:hypothetical protein